MSHKLLLADDSVTIQRVIELTFADQDVQVLTAGDGEQAIASIQAERPDIVLADIGMPKRSGYDVAAFVKGAPELSHIPVLLLTGAFEPVDEGRAQAAGCDGVLVKPFEPQHVIARVRELLEGSATTASRSGGTVTRAVADVPRPVERLTPQRVPAQKPATPLDGEPAGRPMQEAVRPGSDLDAYFDRLDAAFANITASIDTPPPPQPEVTHRREGPVMERDLDWFDPPSQEASVAASAWQVSPSPPVAEPVPVTFASPSVSPVLSVPQPPMPEPPDSPPERAPQAARPVPARTTSTDPGSSIAEAFSALLAAEQGDPDATPVIWSGGGGSAPAINDDLVEEVARRVLDRLSSSAVHDLVADVVSRVAERLVREEIERIRNKHS